MKLKDLLPNPNNPRIVNDDKFKKLVASIRDFPKMMELRPIVIDANNIILGGNMRFKALKELKYKDIPDTWVKRASDLTDEEKLRFIIADNVGFGEWDWELLKLEWDADDLGEWGLETITFDEVDYSDKNQEIDIDDMDGDMTLKLTYCEDDYERIKEELSNRAGTPEKIIFELIFNE